MDELAGNWQSASNLLSLPALNNSHGSGKATRDVLAVGDLSFPPITLTGDTGALLIDGQKPVLDQTRWYPFQVLRTATAGNLRVATAVRMVYGENGLLFHIAVTNEGPAGRTFELKIMLSAGTSQHDKWGWKVPRPHEPSRFSAVVTNHGGVLLLDDSLGQLANVFAFEHPPDELTARGGSGEALWRVSLAPQAVLTINYALGIGKNEAAVPALTTGWAAHFDDEFVQVQNDWAERFVDMFTPGNSHYSGYLPVLVTSDEKMRRLYYMSAVSLLSVCRTGFPAARRVYVSNTPESNCTMMYFWDTREWATVLALLDPAMLKEYLRKLVPIFKPLTAENKL